MTYIRHFNFKSWTARDGRRVGEGRGEQKWLKRGEEEGERWVESGNTSADCKLARSGRATVENEEQKVKKKMTRTRDAPKY